MFRELIQNGVGLLASQIELDAIIAGIIGQEIFGQRSLFEATVGIGTFGRLFQEVD